MKKEVKQVGLITLDVKKVKETEGIYKGLFRTEFYQNGVLKAVVPANQRQPRKGQKTFRLNGWNFNLKW